MENRVRQVEEMAEVIGRLRKTADELRDRAEGIEAVERNLDRISANIRMLEINVSDLQGLP